MVHRFSEKWVFRIFFSFEIGKLVGFYGISTIVGYLMPNLNYVWFINKEFVDNNF